MAAVRHFLDHEAHRPAPQKRAGEIADHAAGRRRQKKEGIDAEEPTPE
jgi:hypothetical protein